MARSDRRHARRTSAWLPVLLVLVLLGGAAAAYHYGLTDRWFGDDAPSPSTEPAAVPPPEGLDLPTLTSPAPVARAARDTDGVTRQDVSRALAGLRNRDLGKHVTALVTDLDDGRPLFASGSDTVTPASTMKLLTCAAALATFGPDHRFATTVVRRGRAVTLVGGGDPLLTRKPDPGAWPHLADLTSLAQQTASALREDGIRRVRVGYDSSLFSGPAVSPAWEAGYVPDGVVSPISALWLDEGRAAGSYSRVADPAATAGQEFAQALARRGITTLGSPQEQSGRGSTVATVESPPLSQVVEHTLLVSDNEAAEVLAHQVGLEVTGTGSFSGGVRGVTRTLQRMGVDLRRADFADGSGLARSDRLDPRTLVSVLSAVADRPELRAVLTGLPVAGFTGSLTYRFDDAPPAGVGRVRAKTGTLTGVSALAGVAQTAGGDELAFVLVADKVRLRHTLDARDALDRLAATLAGAA